MTVEVARALTEVESQTQKLQLAKGASSRPSADSGKYPWAGAGKHFEEFVTADALQDQLAAFATYACMTKTKWQAITVKLLSMLELCINHS